MRIFLGFLVAGLALGAAVRLHTATLGNVPAPVGRDGGGGRELNLMAGGTPLERWLDEALARAGTPRRAAVVVAAASTAITVVAGFLMTVADHDNFPSIGRGMWFSVQTVTTVGYGDVVPTTVAGRLIAALVCWSGSPS